MGPCEEAEIIEESRRDEEEDDGGGDDGALRFFRPDGQFRLVDSQFGKVFLRHGYGLSINGYQGIGIRQRGDEDRLLRAKSP
jgi:hypothetical protein